MSVVTRCRGCGRELVADRQAIVAGTWRLCADCRPVPPSGGGPAADDEAVLPCPAEAAS